MMTGVDHAPERRRHERRLASDRQFWRALKGERRVAERRRATPAPATRRGSAKPDATRRAPPREPETRRRLPLAADARRAVLRNMLQAAEARQDRLARMRRPVLAEGTRVRVLRGDLAGLTGIILDADYIESRVLIRFDDRERPCWVPFSRVGRP